jgi:hypothetical protein
MTVVAENAGGVVAIASAVTNAYVLFTVAPSLKKY